MKWGIITAQSDPERWQMEMIDAALDGLDTFYTLLDAKLNEHALEKLKQVKGDLKELREHLLHDLN